MRLTPLGTIRNPSALIGIWIIGNLAWSAPAGQLEGGPAATTSAPLAPLQVQVVGNGPPMLLIPGLMCDGSVWKDSVEHFRHQHQCHVLSLAGFAGAPPVPGPFLLTMRNAILQYIRSHHLVQPVLVGHSLGGSLALSVAVQAPSEVGRIIVVDGVPAPGFLMFPQATPHILKRQSAMLKEFLIKASAQAFAIQNESSFARLVADPTKARALAALANRSDQASVGRAMEELMTLDLRSQVSAITSPVLVIAGTHAAEPVSQATIRQSYESQFANVKRHQITLAADSRHFVMLDRPDFFLSVVDAFLAESR